MFLFSFFSRATFSFMIKLFLELIWGMSGFLLQVPPVMFHNKGFINYLLFLYFIQIIISKTMKVYLDTLYGFHYIRIQFHYQLCFMGGGTHFSLLSVVLLSVHDLKCSSKIMKLEILNIRKYFCQLTKCKNIFIFLAKNVWYAHLDSQC